MAEHLSNETILLYQHKSLSATARFYADSHLASCPTCREKLEQANDRDALQSFYQAVQANFLYPAEDICQHLTDEQVLGYVKKQLDAVEFEIVTSHLVWCAECQSDVQQMRDISSQFSSRQEKFMMAWVACRQFMEKTLEIACRPFQSVEIRWEVILSAALLILCLWSGWAYFNKQAAQYQVARIAQPSITTLKNGLPDSGSPVVRQEVPKSPPVMALLLPQDEQLVDRAIKQGKFDVPPIVEDTNDSTMGNQDKESFRLIGPGNLVIRETRPTIRWRPLEGVSTYKVIVTKADESRKEVANLLVEGTQWKPDTPFERNQRYTWQVIADPFGKEIYGTWSDRTYANFFVIAQGELEQVKKAEQYYKQNGNPLARIALAARYAKAGLIEDAKRELVAFPKQHPQAPLVAQLLGNLTRKKRNL